ncbi:hypothetical protein EC973_006140 [Apophysomyces ossiformis]|uniref:Uncharacterized protein n=1 Tax=Apophysomyces ossiformis TaxID=679940 RepID=A0A8H7EJW1_9FUNG|nr:hypothetical protein EC973_006140 [Apophysomyces ossiformis]
MPNDATGYSPAMLLFGYKIHTPATWPAPRVDYIKGELQNEVNSHIKVIQHMSDKYCATAIERTKRKQEKRKQWYDNMVEPVQFQVGSEVPMHDQHKEGKFDDTWIGPLKVLKANNNGTYWLTGPHGKRLEGAVNRDQLTYWHNQKQMTPDVVAKRAHDQWERFIARKRYEIENPQHF